MVTGIKQVVLQDDVIIISLRECEIALHLAKGLSNPEIAKILNISPRTVQCHISHLCDKLQVNSRISIIVEMLKLGHLKLDNL